MFTVVYHEVPTHESTLVQSNIQRSSLNSFICDLCPNVFFNKVDFDKHRNEHSTEKKLVCSVCQKEFKRKLDLSIHTYNHSNKNIALSDRWILPRTRKVLNKDIPTVKKRRSKVNDKAIISNGRDLHSRADSCVSKFVCDVCQKSFKDKQSLNSHLSTHQYNTTGNSSASCEKSHVSKSLNKRTITVKRRSSEVHYEPIIQNSIDLNQYILVDSVETKFICEICQKAFKEMQSLNSHICIPVDKKPFVCAVCQKAFNEKQVFDDHNCSFACEECQKVFTEKHSLEEHICNNDRKPCVCEVCQTAFESKQSLDGHICINTSFHCKICQKAFNEKQAFDEHICSNNNNCSFACEECQKVFTEKHSLKEHICNNDRKPCVCEVCHTAFESKQSLDGHICINTSFHCKICQKAFQNKQSMDEHMCMKTDEKTSIKNFKCYQCGKLYTIKSHLDQHKLTCGNFKGHLCTLCKKTFKFKWLLNYHMNVHTGMKPLFCHRLKHLKNDYGKCGETYFSRQSLDEHICIRSSNSSEVYLKPCENKQSLDENIVNTEKKTLGKKFKCHKCEKVYCVKEHFDAHKLICVGLKRFLCNVCLKPFQYKYVLNDHMNLHTCIRPYVCRTCNKAFAHRYSLMSHRLVHSKPKFNYDRCGKSYSSNQQLNFHKMKHYGVKKPFICNVCEKAYSSKQTN